MREPLRGAVAAAAGLALTAACITPVEFRSLEREVAALSEERAAGQGAQQDTRLAELGAQLLDLERETAALRGEVEEVRHLAAEALARAIEHEKKSAAAPRTPAPVPGEPDPGDSPVAVEVAEYEEAFRLYRSRDYPGAIDRFKGFLQNYPDSEYADNALFWIGECWFKLEDYEQAVLTFDEVAKTYPDGNKVADAHYRQGIALMEIGRRTQQEKTYNAAAREIFEKIVNQYPNSDRVPEARRQLEKLGS
jgi:tol-pal system protein YbgF